MILPALTYRIPGGQFVRSVFDTQVPRDGPLGVFMPTTAAHWALLGLPAPNFLYSCQEASGNLVPAIGDPTVVLTASGTPLYQQTVTGWTSKFVGTADGAAQYFATTNAALNLAAGESYAVLSYASMASGSVQRAFTRHQDGAAPLNTNCWAINANGTLASFHGGVPVTSATSYSSLTTVHPLLWYRASAADRAPAAAASGTFTDLHSLAGAHNESPAPTATRSIGGANTAPSLRWGLHAIWKGPNAAAIAQKATLTTLGWPVPY